ncbi:MULTISPECIES: hypothetical protein [unclassified Streptomyces]|uniref:hypothetical protein n=1 Tax=unclassified Streptomyces TaxID=2593676 RepID=UPI002E29F94C|nr:hypothetical protein [Streptomyces sp. NBC_00223]
MMRLLPWLGFDGKPCYLDTDADGSSFLSRLADNMEAVQLGMGRDLLDNVQKCTVERMPLETELRAFVTHLCMALADVLRVAESRGQRVPVPDADIDESDAARLAEMVRAFTDGRTIARQSAS